MGRAIAAHRAAVRADRASVELYSPSSRVYLFHLVPVAAAVRDLGRKHRLVQRYC